MSQQQARRGLFLSIASFGAGRKSRKVDDTNAAIRFVDDTRIFTGLLLMHLLRAMTDPFICTHICIVTRIILV